MELEMNGKNLDVCILLDFYGELLTNRQRGVIEMYYNEDLSLQEVADHVNITRQGVRDLVKRAEAVLFRMEDKLGLASRFSEMKKDLDAIMACATEINQINNKQYIVKEINDKANEIIRRVNALQI